MLEPPSFLEILSSEGVQFYSGVPDSLLKHFCACVADNISQKNHIIAANEGAAVGLAIGHYLGTGELPLVYLQNSGLGNLINPLLSLASPEVYAVPMLLMIGWRGEPGVHDEPQHIHQGRVMLDMLDVMGIQSFVLSEELDIARTQMQDAVRKAMLTEAPLAIVVRKDSFAKYSPAEMPENHEISREDAIRVVADLIEPDAAVVCTTGMASRELYEYRAMTKHGHHRDFLTVGGMGHASQIALGLSLSQPSRRIYCFDGDGAALMHMGSMAISGVMGGGNFTHLVFNNGVHASVGGQPTVARDIDLPNVAASAGYQMVQSVASREEIKSAILRAQSCNSGPSFVEIKVGTQNRENLGRPQSSPVENKHSLMKFLASG